MRSIYSRFVISVILERGNKLRNAMVVSALKCDVDSAPPLKESPLPLPTDNIQLPDKFVVLFLFSKNKTFYNVWVCKTWELFICRSFPSPAGIFLQDILHADSALKPSDDAALATEDCLGCPTDMDRRAVELLLGRFVLLHLHQNLAKTKRKHVCFKVYFPTALSRLHYPSGVYKAPPLTPSPTTAACVPIVSSVILCMIKAYWKTCSTKLL